MNSRKVRVPELAEYLGVSRHTIYKWCQQGWVPVGRAGRALVFDVAAVEAWLRDRGSTGQVESPTLLRSNRVEEKSEQILSER